MKTVKRVSESLLLGSALEFQRDRLGLMMRVARECGEMGAFRVGPLRIIQVNSARLTEALLTEHDSMLSVGALGRLFVPVLGEESPLALDGEPHMRFRRASAPAFQPKRLIRYTQPMAEFADQFQRGLQDGATLNVEAAMVQLSRNIIAKTFFDESVEGEGVDVFSAAVDEVVAYLARMTARPVPIPLSWPLESNRRVRAAIEVLQSRLKQLIQQGREAGVDRGDFLSMLLMFRDSHGNGLSELQLQSYAMTTYFGGYVTIANTLAWLWLTLGAHPEIRTKLEQEAEAVLRGRLPTHEDLPKLPYALRVIKETLRLYPPLFLFGREPAGDLEVSGYPLRKGQVLLFSPYVLHRDPELFPEPERFEPDRFLPEKEKALPRGAYIPFGWGAHACIGQRFAMMEMHLAVAHLAQHLTFESLPGARTRPLALAVLKPDSANMVVRRRNGASTLSGARGVG
ncbi:cytochrome P450 [Cystobacter fuscus]